MKICEFLKEDHVFIDLEPGDKTSLLKEFVSGLKKRSLISEEKVILEELLKRETLGSTGLENGIAVPHALTKEVKDPLLALALMKEGVDFEAVDRMPTFIIILLLGNIENPGLQLKLLAHICRLVKETDFVEKTKKASTRLDICKILEEEEKKI